MSSRTFVHTPAVVLTVAMFLATGAVTESAAQGRSAPAPAAPAAAPPNWLAWKVFHESLAFYSRQSAKPVADMLRTQLGLQAGEAALVLTAGQSFVAAINQIDVDARSEVLNRYGTTRQPPADRRSTSAPVVTRRGKTMRDMVVEDGLFAQVEGKKTAALARHLAALRQALGPTKVTQIGHLVDVTVAPRINTFGRGTAVTAIDRSSSGNVFVAR